MTRLQQHNQQCTCTCTGSCMPRKPDVSVPKLIHPLAMSVQGVHTQKILTPQVAKPSRIRRASYTLSCKHCLAVVHLAEPHTQHMCTCIPASAGAVCLRWLLAAVAAEPGRRRGGHQQPPTAAAACRYRGWWWRSWQGRRGVARTAAQKRGGPSDTKQAWSLSASVERLL